MHRSSCVNGSGHGARRDPVAQRTKPVRNGYPQPIGCVSGTLPAGGGAGGTITREVSLDINWTFSIDFAENTPMVTTPALLAPAETRRDDLGPAPVVPL